jgi:hypothetical protein
MKRSAVDRIVCAIGLIAHSLLYFFPQAQSHASLESILSDYCSARTQTLVVK